jgi:hypothetical protein
MYDNINNKMEYQHIEISFIWKMSGFRDIIIKRIPSRELEGVLEGFL